MYAAAAIPQGLQGVYALADPNPRALGPRHYPIPISHNLRMIVDATQEIGLDVVAWSGDIRDDWRGKGTERVRIGQTYEVRARLDHGESGPRKVGDTRRELVFRGSTSCRVSQQVEGGKTTLVCSNGMTTGNMTRVLALKSTQNAPTAIREGLPTAIREVCSEFDALDAFHAALQHFSLSSTELHMALGLIQGTVQGSSARGMGFDGKPGAILSAQICAEARRQLVRPGSGNHGLNPEDIASHYNAQRGRASHIMEILTHGIRHAGSMWTMGRDTARVMDSLPSVLYTVTGRSLTVEPVATVEPAAVATVEPAPVATVEPAAEAAEVAAHHAAEAAEAAEGLSDFDGLLDGIIAATERAGT